MGTLKTTNIQTITGSGTLTIGTSGETLTVPTGVTTTLTDGVSGDLKFNSGFGSVATAYGCRAWVNFNGVGTLSIRDSGNVSSITDNGTGLYTLNFTSSMPDANYSVAGIGNGNTGGVYVVIAGAAASGADVMTTSQIKMRNKDQDGNNVDSVNTCIQVFR